jgi:GT2 family glycosyltransferase
MLYIIVPVHNRAQVTEEFLSALADQTFTQYTVILVNDGCTDETVAIARSKLPATRLVVLDGDGELWWAGALEMAYQHLLPLVRPDDRVLISNDDISFGTNFLESGVALLDCHRDACLQAVGIDRESGTIDRGTMIDERRLHFRAARAGESPNCLSTRGLLMTGDTFARSGGFKPHRLPHYLSDYEFTIRLRRQGVRLMCDERFQATVNLGLTGIDGYDASGLREFWSRAFSNRAKLNPKHWTAFVVLVCAPATVPLHILRIWVRFARAFFAAARAGWSQHGNA